MIYAYRTEIGRRKTNQDYFFTPEENDRPVVIVADGMGGHRAGNVASLVAVDSIHEYIESSDIKRPLILLQHAVNYANQRIFDIASGDDDCMGMGTTAVIAYCEAEKFTFANVGDSRLYLFDGQQLRQLTRDHSLVEELVQAGVITRSQAAIHPQRNILTRAVGTSQYVKADTGTIRWTTGDILLLCSDGLHGSVSKEDMETVLKEHGDLLEACDILTETAFENGSSDNITVVLVKNTEVCYDR